MTAGRFGGARSALLISGGTLAGQVVTFVALPILARIYSPAEFGVYSLALTISALALPLAVLRLDRALLLPPLESTTKSLLWAGTAFAIVIASLVGAGTWVFGTFGRDPLVSVLVALLLLTSAIVALLVPLASREGRYGSLGMRTAAQSVSSTGAQFGFGVAGFTSAGLIGGAVVGSSVGVALLSPYARRLRGRTSIAKICASLRSYWRFPAIFMPIAFLTLLAQQTPLLFGASVFGLDAAGVIGMAERVVAIPVALLGLAVGTVFESEIARSLRARSGGLVRRYLQTSLVLAVVGLVAGAALAIAAPWGLTLLFGEEWSVAGQVAQVMSIVVVTRLVVSATKNLTQLLQRGLDSLGLEITRVILVVGSAATALVMHLDLIPSLWLIYGALAAADVVTWIWGLRVVRSHERQGDRLREKIS